MAKLLKTIGNHPDLGSFRADIMDDGSANIEVDEFISYTPDRIYDLIDALKQVGDALNEEIMTCN